MQQPGARQALSVAQQQPVRADVVGHIGGPAIAVLVRGNYAYLALTGELAIVDISDPEHPQRVGYVLIPARQLAAAGDYLYVGGQDGLYVVNISQPQNPSVVATFPTPHPVFGIAVAQGFVYLAVDRAGLLVVDVASPSTPTQVAALPASGFAWGVAVGDGQVYLAEHLIGLRIFDAYNPEIHAQAGLVERSSVTRSDCLYHVTRVGDDVYVTGKTGVHAIDAGDPDLPRLGAEYRGPSCPRRMAHFGEHLFLAAEDAGLRILRVDDPEELVEVGHVADLGLAMDVAVANGFAYVVGGEGTLHVIDIITPAQPQVVGVLDLLGLVWDVAVSGDYAYVLAGFAQRLYIVDVADPTLPRSVGSVALPHKGLGLTVVGDYVYLADWVAGLRIIDVSDKARPVEIGAYTPAHGTARAVVVHDGYAYLANGESGLVIIDVSEPAKPVALSTLPLNGSVVDVVFVGGYAYASTGRGGLHIIDISEPTHPVARAVLPTSDRVDEMMALTQPVQLVDLGNFASFDKALNVVMTDGYIYVAARMGGLIILRGEEFSTGEGLYGCLKWKVPRWFAKICALMRQ